MTNKSMHKGGCPVCWSAAGAGPWPPCRRSTCGSARPGCAYRRWNHGSGCANGGQGHDKPAGRPPAGETSAGSPEARGGPAAPQPRTGISMVCTLGCSFVLAIAAVALPRLGDHGFEAAGSVPQRLTAMRDRPCGGMDILQPVGAQPARQAAVERALRLHLTGPPSRARCRCHPAVP